MTVPRAATQPREGALILIVEDDAPTRQVLARELASGGYRVVEAGDGRTAHRAVRGRVGRTSCCSTSASRTSTGWR